MKLDLDRVLAAARAVQAEQFGGFEVDRKLMLDPPGRYGYSDLYRALDELVDRGDLTRERETAEHAGGGRPRRWLYRISERPA